MTATYRRVDQYGHHDGADNIRFTTVGEAAPNEWGEKRWPTAHVDLSLPSEEVTGGHYPTYRAKPGEPIQGEMLRTRPGGVIQGAFAHPDMAKHIPTLLGMAANEHRRLYGSNTLPTPDHSLSEQSSEMVKRIRGRGAQIPVNSANPGSEPTNDIRMSDTKRRQELTVGVHDDVGTQTSKADVAAGWNTAKQVLRSAPVTSPHQFRLAELRGRRDQRRQLKLL